MTMKFPERLIPMFPTLPRELAKKLERDLQDELSEVSPKLWPVMSRLFDLNPSSGMPYHNNVHAALFIRAVMLSFPHFNFDERTKYSLIAAGLFHDFDYQTTTNDDIENIKAARMAWATHSMEFLDLEIDPKLVSTLIYGTYLGEPLEPSADAHQIKSIMRDSDLLCWVFKEYREVQRAGLEQEKRSLITTDNLTTRFKVYNQYAIDLLHENGLG